MILIRKFFYLNSSNTYFLLPTSNANSMKNRFPTYLLAALLLFAVCSVLRLVFALPDAVAGFLIGLSVTFLLGCFLKYVGSLRTK